MKGFTLIELVVVIIILSVLSATALPKFIDLKSNSRVAAMQGLEASMKSVANMIHAKALIENEIVDSGTVQVAGVYYSVFNSYPSTHNVGSGAGDSEATASGISSIIDTNIRLMIQQTSGNGKNYTIFSYADSDGYQCNITYNEAQSVYEMPEITTSYTGC